MYKFELIHCVLVTHYNPIGWANNLLLDGTKPLAQSTLNYCPLDIQEYISVKFHLKNAFHLNKNTFERVVCMVAAMLLI